MTGTGPLEGEAATSSDIVAGDQMVEIVWQCTPFRADRFQEIWQPWAEASLEYGAKWYAFFRAQDDQWIFKQIMVFTEKIDFERYWYSEELAGARASAAGLFDVPVLPAFFYPLSQGRRARTPAAR